MIFICIFVFIHDRLVSIFINSYIYNIMKIKMWKFRNQIKIVIKMNTEEMQYMNGLICGMEKLSKCFYNSDPWAFHEFNF